MDKQWGQIIGLVLVALFMSTLLTIKTDPSNEDEYVKGQVSKYSYWEKYELNGMRTNYDDDLRVKFWNRINGLESYCDIQYNNSGASNVPYFVRFDSTIVMRNEFFFNDSIPSNTPIRKSVKWVRAYLLGENDMLVYPYYADAKFGTTYIYLKRRLPYQY